MRFLIKVKRSLVKVKEFDEKGYLDHSVIMPIRLIGVNITLALYYLGQYVENVLRKSETVYDKISIYV